VPHACCASSHLSCKPPIQHGHLSTLLTVSYLQKLLFLLQLIQLLLPLLEQRLAICQGLASAALPGSLAAQHRRLQLQLCSVSHQQAGNHSTTRDLEH
jgi:hypothetical protein